MVEIRVRLIVSDCEVLLTGTENSVSGVSDSDGEVLFRNIPADEYELSLSKEGYEDYTYPELIKVADRNIEVVLSTVITPLPTI